jgi:outer membrane protein assembly factor BamB
MDELVPERRTLLCAVGSAAVGSAAMTSLTAPRRDDGASRPAVERPDDAASGGDVDWIVRTGEMVLSSPTVVGGTAYVGCSGGNLYALDAGTGDEQWVHETDANVHATPTVRDRRGDDAPK